MKVSIPFNSSYIAVEFPDHLDIKLLVPRDLPKLVNEVEEVKKALKNPIASLPLHKLAKQKNAKNAVIIISDLTRPVPDKMLVPPILKELNSAGISHVKVVVATGTHPPPPIKDIEERLGREAIEYIEEIEIHNPRDKNRLVYVGETSLGNKVYINKSVYEADLKIATGCIKPHIIAGYSGGRKSILPGVAGIDTISYNHFNFLFHENVRPGIVDGNPVSCLLYTSPSPRDRG